MVDLQLRRAATGVLFTSALFLVGASPSPPAGPTPTLQADAFVRADGADDFAPTKGGTSLAPSSSVRTAPGVASVMKIAEGVSVRIAPSTTFTLRSTSWLPAEHPGASAVKAFQIQMTEGELDLEAHDPSNGLGLLVMLPGGRSVALWRGSGNVAIHGDDVAVALYDGMAIAGSASKWRPLLPHTGVTLTPKTVLGTHPAPAAPSWLAAAGTPPPFAIVHGDERAVVGASWQPVPGAASYRVEVAPNQGMSGPLTVSKTDSPTMKTDAVGPGSYYVRVRALSTEGLAGPPSDVMALRVARLTVPALAVSGPGGAVVLSENQAITLDDPRDIEVATGSDFDPNAEPRWIPASTELKLGGQPKRTLLIRHATSHVQTKILLVRRDLHAHITFNPPHPRWPDTPVDIVVKVEDPSGYLDPSRETLVFNVTVDLDKPSVSWNHNGDTWTARVMPGAPPGPWVVRVNVQDRTGAPVGAALLDVDGPDVQRAKYQGGDLQVAR
ncbi:MAG: hypothetical protein ACLQVI_03865 [Polyangiaceae bacterium]